MLPGLFSFLDEAGLHGNANLVTAIHLVEGWISVLHVLIIMGGLLADNSFTCTVILKIKSWLMLFINYMIKKSQPLPCFVMRKHKKMFVLFTLSLNWDGKWSWNYSSWKKTICLFCIDNTMVADVLVMQEARTSAAMVLTFLSGIFWFQHQKL